MKHLNNEHGLTLFELLATLVITTMIGMIGFAVLFGGLKTYDRVKIEAELRDEADIIMAEFINELFTLKASEITSKHLVENESHNYYIETDEGKTGFYNDKVYFNDDPNKTLQGDLIKLGNNSKITEIEDGLFRISLTLEWEKSNQSLTTETEINIINDEDK